MSSYKILFQGENFSFGHLAAQKFTENYLQKLDKIQFVKAPQFLDMCLGVQKKQVDFALLPIENSLAGTVISNYDLLYKYPIKICGEIVLPIELQLLAKKNLKIEDIKIVYSHSKALEQCQNFFGEYPQIQKVTLSNTALAAKQISESNNFEIAAIASKQAAVEYNLQTLIPNVADSKNNWTRFVVLISDIQNPLISEILAKNNSLSNFQNLDQKLSLKAAVAYSLPRGEAGSLFKSLQPFAQSKLNLTNIESRPIEGKFFEYIFYVDIEADLAQKNDLQKALINLKKITKNLKILGIYHTKINNVLA